MIVPSDHTAHKEKDNNENSNGKVWDSFAYSTDLVIFDF